VVDAIHHDQVREHGGLPGVRDEGALESALSRPRQKWHYVLETDLAALASAYGFGLVRNHPYRDGKKRIGFLAVVTFLGTNGHDLTATDAEGVTAGVTLAEGHLSEDALAAWIRQHSDGYNRRSHGIPIDLGRARWRGHARRIPGWHAPRRPPDVSPAALGGHRSDGSLDGRDIRVSLQNLGRQRKPPRDFESVLAFFSPRLAALR
jgi:death-on-curing protein